MIAGSVAGMVYLLFAELALALHVDDPLDAFAVHFGGGLWGLVSACLVTEQGLLFAFLGDVKLNVALWASGIGTRRWNCAPFSNCCGKWSVPSPSFCGVL